METITIYLEYSYKVGSFFQEFEEEGKMKRTLCLFDFFQIHNPDSPE